jgi:hypothetical protein
VLVISLATLAGGITDAGLSAIGVRELATRDAVARRVLNAAPLGAATLALGGIPDALRLALALALYGGALLALRAIPREIVDQLPRRLRFPHS